MEKTLRKQILKYYYQINLNTYVWKDVSLLILSLKRMNVIINYQYRLICFTKWQNTNRK